MRPTLTLLFLFALLSSAGFSCRKNSEEEFTFDPNKHEMVIIEINGNTKGMEWPSRIKGALEELDNVYKARVHMINKEVRLTIKKGSYNETKIRKALEKVGFGGGNRIR